MTTTLSGSNRLLRKSILKMYPSSFAAVLTVQIALMVDTLLAGSLISRDAIAAVAIGAPVIGIFQALTQTFTCGSAVKLNIFSGRGDHDNVNTAFSLGLVSAGIMGIIFLTVCLLLAGPLTMLFGGSGNPEVGNLAALYLQASSVCIIMGSFNNYLCKILALYGYQRAVFLSAALAIGGNLVFSPLYIHLLPSELAMVGLGAGTWSGGLLAMISSIIVLKVKKVPLRFRPRSIRLRMLPEIFRLGLPTSGNNLADGLVSGIINNIIVTGLGTTALSVYAAVKGVFSFALAPIMGSTQSVSPLLGILYGARDKNALLRAIRECFWIGMAALVIWSSILIALLPLLTKFYSMQGDPNFRTGVIFCILFTPLFLLVRLATQLFESTEQTVLGLLYSIVPDSVLYPILLVLLLPALGYHGIWLSYSANALPFLLVLFLIRSARFKSLRITLERMLNLHKSIPDNVPMLDISIQSVNTDITSISSRVHAFLSEVHAPSRLAYMTALCLEELAADFVAHSTETGEKNANRQLMDIKMFSDTDSLKIVIRNEAAPYNPLDFSLDKNTFSKVGVKLAQRVARKIEYTYVYKMNIVTIVLDK